MTTNEKIIQAVFDAIDEANMSIPAENQLEKSQDTLLFGPTGKLDSLGIVNLVVAVEQNLKSALELTITLADERSLNQENSPFQSVQSLLDYISMLVEKKTNQ